MKEINIQLSKKKAVITLLISSCFVIAGFLYLNQPDDFRSPIAKNADFIRFVGSLGVLFFGTCSVYIFWKIFDNKPGLTINDKGITDNSNASSVGLIEWHDIRAIRISQAASAKFVVVDLYKPEKYIKRAQNTFLRQVLLANKRMYGSPITILANSLKIKIDDLEDLLITEFKKHSANDTRS